MKGFRAQAFFVLEPIVLGPDPRRLSTARLISTHRFADAAYRAAGSRVDRFVATRDELSSRQLQHWKERGPRY